ncbi:hypothetical protein KIF24_07660 [Micromonospora sp. Llam7]|uniref:hypothetical protein n=1 Tax=Micromonospora tarapacensis TaxID=2835305 RepID=UPI001C82C4C1|nr:hypothetical protein [Micromonospora tarapacensis]MBX7265918.1 hypothetical protein [Micromonospora tarapacensis]
MIDQGRRRVPTPVVAAAIIFLLGNVIQAAQIKTSTAPRATEPRATIFAVGLILLSLALTYGLWHQVGRARTTTAGFAAFNIAYALVELPDIHAWTVLRMVAFAAVVGLLLLPASSRQWFPHGT